MEERRRFVRLPSRLSVQYRVVPSKTSVRTSTRDTGRGGMRFLTDSALPPGTRVEGTVELPGRQQPVSFMAGVVWSGKLLPEAGKTHQRPYEAGVRFLKITPKDLDALLQHAASGGSATPPASS